MLKNVLLSTVLLGGTVAYAEVIVQPSLSPIQPQITDAVTTPLLEESLKRLQEGKLVLDRNIAELEARVIELEDSMKQVEKFHELNMTDLFFDMDSAELNQENLQLVNEVAAFLNKNTAYTVFLEGHTDDRGTREYNLALGAKRASTVKNLLVESGVDANRIKTLSYGKERPAVIGTGEEVWKQNRRVVVVLMR